MMLFSVRSGLQESIRTKWPFDGESPQDIDSPGDLLDLLVDRVLVAVGAELAQFKPVGGIPAIFGGGVTRNPRRSLIGVCATLSAFQRNDDTDALGCHS
jgi:hypothetical protein